MLEHLITSRARIKILEHLIFNQDQEYHLRGIARTIKTSPIYIAKELDNLRELNLILKTKKGNLTFYAINKQCVILEEIRSIFLKTDYIGNLLRKQLEKKAVYCFIYGSFAKGKETKNSDIDLFVISEMKENELLMIIQSAEKIIKREINYVLWNNKTFKERAKQHHLLKTLKNDKIIMIIGDEHEFRKLI